jgi:hypothetical protein
MGRHRESTPLKIGDVQTPPAQMLFEDAVLFPEIGHHLKLTAIRLAGEGDHQDLPSDRVEHPPSLPATAAFRARPNFRIVRGSPTGIPRSRHSSLIERTNRSA